MGEQALLYQNDAEVLFPARVIPSLRDLRGEDWEAFVDRVSAQPENAPDVLAFSLMMIRLNSCMTCHADSYRAMRGCTICAQQVIARFRGTDGDLIARWQAARADILHYLMTGDMPIAY